MPRFASVLVGVAPALLLLAFVGEAHAQFLYYVYSANLRQIVRTNLDGSNPEVLLTQLDIQAFGDSIGVNLGTTIRGMAVDAVAGKLYWITDSSDVSSQDYVLRSNLDGSNIEVVIEPPNGLDLQTPLVIYRPSVAVPAVSTIGMVVMVALLLGAGAVVLARRQRTA